MWSELRTRVKCARARPWLFWLELGAPGVLSRDTNSEMKEKEVSINTDALLKWKESKEVSGTTESQSSMVINLIGIIEINKTLLTFSSPSGQDAQQWPGSTFGLAHDVVGQRFLVLRHATFPTVARFECYRKRNKRVCYCLFFLLLLLRHWWQTKGVLFWDCSSYSCVFRKKKTHILKMQHTCAR